MTMSRMALHTQGIRQGLGLLNDEFDDSSASEGECKSKKQQGVADDEAVAFHLGRTLGAVCDGV